jgi:CubicO group peptidase (beta-lactamase class C family)
MSRTAKFTLVISLFLSSSSFALSQSADDLITERIKTFVEEVNAVSVNVALVRDGQIIYKEAFGKANVEKGIDATTKHQYMIGSVSKLFTGTAIMQLVEQGKIDLTADINEYLPFKVRNPEYPQIPITIKMLMTHTSSFAVRRSLQKELYVDGDPEMSLKELSNKYFDNKGKFYEEFNFEEYQPGEKWAYRNWNYVLLGYIVERVTGMQYYEYSYKDILEPLEMHSSKWFLRELDLDDLAIHYQPNESGEQSPVDFYGWPGYPDGQLRSNVEEMSNFLIMYLNDGEFRGKRILTGDSISRIFTTNEFEGLTGRVFKGMGLTWFVDAGYDSVFSHGGSPTATRIDVLIDKASNSGFVLYVTGIDEMKEGMWNKIVDLKLYLQRQAAGTE